MSDARIARRVQGRAGASAGGEQFVDHGVVDHADLDLAADHGGDRDAEMRRAAREIRGAVDRVDHPDRRAFMPDAAFALLADEAVLGKQAVQARRDQALHLAVDLGQVVLRSLETDSERAAVDEPPPGDLSGLARERAGDVETGVQGAGVECHGMSSGLRNG